MFIFIKHYLTSKIFIRNEIKINNNMKRKIKNKIKKIAPAPKQMTRRLSKTQAARSIKNHFE